MREILFRGKVADEPDEWVIGDLLRSFGHFEYMIRQYDTHDKTKCCGIGTFNVKSETVGQYTGLTDKNGVKIFEGDIVLIPGYARCGGGKHKTTVYFAGGKFAVDGSNYSFKDIKPKTLEVIGNIYDNPELLKGAETT